MLYYFRLSTGDFPSAVNASDKLSPQVDIVLLLRNSNKNIYHTTAVWSDHIIDLWMKIWSKVFVRPISEKPSLLRRLGKEVGGLMFILSARNSRNYYQVNAAIKFNHWKYSILNIITSDFNPMSIHHNRKDTSFSVV